MPLRFDPLPYEYPEPTGPEYADKWGRSLNQLGETFFDLNRQKIAAGELERRNRQDDLEQRIAEAGVFEKYGDVGARKILRPGQPPRKILGQSRQVNLGQPMSVAPDAPLESFDLANPQQFSEARRLYGSSGVQPYMDAEDRRFALANAERAGRLTESQIAENNAQAQKALRPEGLSPNQMLLMDERRRKIEESEARNLEARAAKTNDRLNTIDNIDRAIDLVGRSTTGVFGSLTGGVWQPTADLTETLEAISSQLATGKIMEMRSASRTGAGLGGNTSDRDIDLLKKSIRSLSQRQSPELLRKNLFTVKEILSRANAEGVASVLSDPGEAESAARRARIAELKAKQGAR